MNILWQSNSPQTPSGYGGQTALFSRRLAQDHTLSIFAYYGLEGSPLRWEGMTLLPRAADAWGNDIIAAHFRAVRADLLITLTDVWVLEPEIYGALPWLAWTPIDHEPIPPRVLESLRACRWPVAMSRFGEKLMREAGLTPRYIPHGVSTRIFRPIADRAAARQKLGWDERPFIAMMNAANKGDPSRKGLREALQAWRTFINPLPAGSAILYLHTDAFGRLGVPLLELAEQLGIADSVRFPDAYRYAIGAIPAGELALMYNAADVLLNPSMGEGFGVPLIEAQACGTPVIVTDFSAMRELCLAGWPMAGTPVMTYQNAWQRAPSVPAIVEALRAAYDARGDMRLRVQAAESAREYDVERVYQRYWRPALEAIRQTMVGKLSHPA